MSDFDKTKITFVLALLAAVFALNPMVEKLPEVYVEIFKTKITLSNVYFGFATMLGTSVYFFAVGLVGERRFFYYSTVIANIAYSIALTIFPVYCFLYLIYDLMYRVDLLWRSINFVQNAQFALSAIAVLASSLSVAYLSKKFVRKDKINKDVKIDRDSSGLLMRAKSLFEDEYYEMSTVEASKAVEIFLNNKFSSYASGSSIARVNLSNIKHLMSDDQIGSLVFIRRVRNEVVHGKGFITRDNAKDVLDHAGRLIASLSDSGEECYFCGKRNFNFDIETDDITGASVCKTCAKKHPDWKSELVDLGMDP